MEALTKSCNSARDQLKATSERVEVKIDRCLELLVKPDSSVDEVKSGGKTVSLSNNLRLI